jgi:hypothetical protein
MAEEVVIKVERVDDSLEWLDKENAKLNADYEAASIKLEETTGRFQEMFTDMHNLHTSQADWGGEDICAECEKAYPCTTLRKMEYYEGVIGVGEDA